MNTATVRPVLADVFIGKRHSTLLNTLVLTLLGSLIMATCAQIAIPLPFTPVPITGQTFGVLLVGTMLGAKRGALSAVFYLLEGAMGLPVFAGFKGGLPHLLGPTGGYLFGFIATAYVVGYLAERGWDRGVLKTALIMLVGNTVTYLFGLSWLSYFVGISNVFALGFIPFLIGDVLKIIVLMITMPLVWRIVRQDKN